MKSRRATRTAVALSMVLASGLVVSAEAATPAARLPHVLVYDQTLGYHHKSIEYAEPMLRRIATYDGKFTIEFSKDPNVLNKRVLSRTDVVLWLSNTAGEGRVSPFTDAQEAAYAQWMLCGGGHVGVHAAVDSYNDKAFPAYVEANGAIFTGHPITATSILDDQDIENEGWGEARHTLRVLDQKSPMTIPWRGKDTFQVSEEIYQLDRDPATVVTDYHQLLGHVSVDDPQGALITPINPGPYKPNAPISWTGSYRHKNRTFYTNLGHSVASWRDANFLRHLTNGITWTAKPGISKSCLKSHGFPK